ncbi:fimbrial protein [Klebsiella aerogenes]
MIKVGIEMSVAVITMKMLTRFFCLVSTIFVLPAFADDLNVKVHVTVISPPPCKINDDKPIEVDFGDVMTTRIDGNNYRMPINYSLDCKDSTGKSFRLQISGSSASFDNKVLLTNIQTLGVELQQMGNKISVNEWIEFVYPAKPELWAVPVTKRGSKLPGGEFTAGATLRLDYQ